MAGLWVVVDFKGCDVEVKSKNCGAVAAKQHSRKNFRSWDWFWDLIEHPERSGKKTWVARGHVSVGTRSFSRFCCERFVPSDTGKLVLPLSVP